MPVGDQQPLKQYRDGTAPVRAARLGLAAMQ
jgi:hypothetical protein